jgi:hypothetical protein
MSNFKASCPLGDAQPAEPFTPRFSAGQVVATPGALAAMQAHGCSPLDLLRRHLSGDWGTVPREDAQANEQALKYGDRLLSSYLIAPGVVIWLITKASLDCSTFLTPSEY